MNTITFPKELNISGFFYSESEQIAFLILGYYYKNESNVLNKIKYTRDCAEYLNGLTGTKIEDVKINTIDYGTKYKSCSYISVFVETVPSEAYSLDKDHFWTMHKWCHR